MRLRTSGIGTVSLFVALGACSPALALTWGTFGTWDSQPRRDAANATIQRVTDRFNAYGNFDWGNDGDGDVNDNTGIGTAQANLYGAITFGGAWPNDRVTMHELNHWLGTGTYSDQHNLPWNGPRTVRLVEQFDNVGADSG